MRVLVTGVTGHVGRVTAREFLEHGYIVRGIDVVLDSHGLRDQGVEMVYADIADQMSMMRVVEGCDAIVHCAAYPTPFNKSTSELLRVNVIGTQNMLDAAAAHRVKTTIITSSIGALGFSFPKQPCLPDYLPVDVAHPRRPQDAYGLSKVMNEESAEMAARGYGINTIVFRPPWIPDLRIMAQNPWLRHRIEQLSESRSDDLWAYVDVHDLAIAYRLAVEKELTGYHSFYIMADDVMARSEAPDLIRKFLPERSDDIPKLTGNTPYDLTPARDILGFQHQRVWRDYLTID